MGAGPKALPGELGSVSEPGLLFDESESETRTTPPKLYRFRCRALYTGKDYTPSQHRHYLDQRQALDSKEAADGQRKKSLHKSERT